MTIIPNRRLSLLAAGASLAIIAGVAPAHAQESSQGNLWSGWYIGANAGGSWGDTKLSSQVATGTGPVVLPPTDVVLINGVTHNGSNKTGFTGGVEAGYNWVSDSNWLLGLEAEWVALSTNSRDSHSITSGITLPIIPPPPPVVYTSNQRADTDWMVDIRPRLGYVSGPWLFQVSAGVAFADVKASQQLVASTSPPQSVATGNSATKTGWIVGAGLGYAIDQNWSIKGEYLYADFGTTRTTGVSPNGFASLTSSAEVKTNILRIGIDYRFAPAAPAAPTASAAASAATTPTASAAASSASASSAASGL